MELRQLDALLAVAEEGSFTAAADRLRTVQSNVSEQVKQLEQELGVPLFVRTRRGTVPTEFGETVLDRVRHVRSELDAMHQDLSMLQGLETGHATLGVIGTVSRWLVPQVVAEMRRVAPRVSMRINESASERLVAEVATRELALAIVTEPVVDNRVVVEHLLDEALVGVVPPGLRIGRGPVSLADLTTHRLILPPTGNPLRDEIEAAAREERVPLHVDVEVEGVRLIADLVAAGAGVSILPEQSIARDDGSLRTVPIEGIPRRRLAMVATREVQLSLADQAVRDAVVRLVREKL